MPKLFSPNLDLIVAEGLNLVVEYFIHVGLLLPNRPGTSKRNSGHKMFSPELTFSSDEMRGAMTTRQTAQEAKSTFERYCSEIVT